MSSPSTSWKDVCTYSSYFANSNNKAIWKKIKKLKILL
jgi:hypothetical protein